MFAKDIIRLLVANIVPIVGDIKIKNIVMYAIILTQYFYSRCVHSDAEVYPLRFRKVSGVTAGEEKPRAHDFEEYQSSRCVKVD